MLDLAPKASGLDNLLAFPQAAFAALGSLGMDSGLVDRARQLVDTDDQRLEEVVSRLEDSRRALESELAAAEAARAAARRAEEEAEQRLNRMEADRDREAENARAEEMCIRDRRNRQGLLGSFGYRD